jgi:hypothetical protein
MPLVLSFLKIFWPYIATILLVGGALGVMHHQIYHKGELAQAASDEKVIAPLKDRVAQLEAAAAASKAAVDEINRQNEAKITQAKSDALHAEQGEKLAQQAAARFQLQSKSYADKLKNAPKTIDCQTWLHTDVSKVCGL